MNYKTSRWIRLREVVLKRDKYMCQECRRYGKNTDAHMVHHIFPADEVTKYQYLKENLISLCNACHNMMHYRESRELTSIGDALLNRHRERIEEAWQRKSQLIS